MLRNDSKGHERCKTYMHLHGTVGKIKQYIAQSMLMLC